MHPDHADDLEVGDEELVQEVGQARRARVGEGEVGDGAALEVELAR